MTISAESRAKQSTPDVSAAQTDTEAGGVLMETRLLAVD